MPVKFFQLHKVFMGDSLRRRIAGIKNIVFRRYGMVVVFFENLQSFTDFIHLRHPHFLSVRGSGYSFGGVGSGIHQRVSIRL